MKAILSHPFSGALYWWLAAQSNAVGQQDKRPTHGYYRTLYGDVDRNLDLALACAVLFEHVVLPAADAPYPEFVRRGEALYLPALEFESEWDVVSEAMASLEGAEEELLRDPVIRRVFAALPEDARRMALLYATADVLLTQAHLAPVLCAPGRRRVIARLIELCFVTVPDAVASAIKRSGDLIDGLEDYVQAVTLRFTSRTIDSLADVKWNEKIRRYAQGFQSALLRQERGASDRLFEDLAAAWDSAELAGHISGAFSATNRVLGPIGLIPGAGTVTGLAGIGADAAAQAADRRREAFRWYEFGPEVHRYESLRDLEAELRRRGLRS